MVVLMTAWFISLQLLVSLCDLSLSHTCFCYDMVHPGCVPDFGLSTSKIVT